MENSPVTVRAIEEHALNAWPPLEQLLLDGWLLRFAGGFTRRANSVNPIHAGAMATPAKVALCEQIYAGRGFRCVFKITPIAHPPGLDGELERLGFAREAETQVRLLEELPPPPHPPPARQEAGELLVREEGLDDWLGPFSRMNEIEGFDQPALRAILEHIPCRKGLATLSAGGRVVACGLAVVEREAVGLFDLVTDAAVRRQGHGERLVRGLLDWARRHGARRAYLQVVAENAPAIHLYEKLEFRELYRYWYRVKG